MKQGDTSCFNEAAGIHRRKQLETGVEVAGARLASMRPPEFTGGNSISARSSAAS